MGTRDPRVDAYIAKSAPFAKPVLTCIREAVHTGCPDVEETMKWSFPHFDYKGILCSMASFKAHCAFGFWKASLLQGSGGGTKAADAMGQFGRLTSVKDLPKERTLVGLVKKAAALNDAGVKVPRQASAAPKPPPKVPTYFMAALRKNTKALAAFESFSPSHKREYVEWVEEAKGEATRQRRLERAVEWMAEGKSRNWKYVR